MATNAIMTMDIMEYKESIMSINYYQDSIASIISIMYSHKQSSVNHCPLPNVVKHKIISTLPK